MRFWAFDLDGTLVDSFNHYFESLRAIYSDFGQTFTPDLHYSALTNPLIEMFERHLGKDSINHALTRLRELSNRDAQFIRPFDGVKPTIEALLHRGDRVAVWTNRDLTSAELIIEHAGLKPYIELCVSGTCVQQRKPHPEGLLRIADHFGCKPQQMAMVGDHEHDIIGARAIGAKAIRASWHGHWEIDPCNESDLQFFHVTDFGQWTSRTMLQEVK